MIQDFKQVWVSHGVQFFRDGFESRWGLNAYGNNTSPSIFLGMYRPEDFDMLVKHKGPKMVIWGGGDMKPTHLQYISQLQKEQEIYCWAYPGEFSNILNTYGVKHKKLHIALKDYSTFTPTTLGENIYVYKGIHGNRPDHYRWDEVVSPLIEVFGEDRIKFANHLSIDELIEKVYKDCFVYIKPTPKGGCTSMFELGHMGIRTLGNSHEKLDCFSDYQNNIHKLIELIMEESKYIGKIRNNIAESTIKSLIGPGWLNLKFWR